MSLEGHNSQLHTCRLQNNDIFYFSEAISQENCTDCPAGKFCSGKDPTGITGNCSAGYYCTGGSDRSDQNAAQPGYYAEEGSFDQTICPCGELLLLVNFMGVN